jgi:outer membrane protein TolC
VKALALSFAELDAAPPLPEQPAREALLNRLDLRRKLMEFAAADAAVKLAVARQSPDISLSPGYLWDQSDNVWSLAANLLMPSDQSAFITEAVARRELAAQSFLQLQIQITQETETAAELVQTAREQAEIFQRASEQHALKEARLTRQLEAGYADRVEQVEAQIEALTARRSLAQSRVRLQQALGSLEDVVQRPLSGFPLTRDEILNGPLARQ